MSPKFEAAYLHHAALAFDKQLNLANVVENRSWGFSMDSGTLTFAKQGFFGSPLEFDTQILGSAAEGSSTWLWSWANKSVPDELCRASLLLREKGELPEFSTPEFPIDLSNSDEHRIAMTSSGILANLFGCDAYYRGPYEGGAAFFLLSDARLHLPPTDVIHIGVLLPQLISSLSLSNHRAAFMGYLDLLQIQARIEGDEVHVTTGNSTLNARFDNQNRLADIQVNARR